MTCSEHTHDELIISVKQSFDQTITTNAASDFRISVFPYTVK